MLIDEPTPGLAIGPRELAFDTMVRAHS
jgi:hypothetical protein